MITGEVNAEFEATIPIVVCGANGEERQVSAVIDTGFTGFLTLSVHSFDVYGAVVIWNGETREVEVNLTETAPLIGMAMLFRHDLQIEVVVSGTVRIEAALPSTSSPPRF